MLLLLTLLSACGGGGTTEGNPRPVVVVTTPLLGDVVSNLVGPNVEVDVLMPVGSDPHHFQPSARQAQRLRAADAIVANGGRFEEGLVDVLAGAAADGTSVFQALDAVDALEFGSPSHDGHDHEGHDDGGLDPHFFTDPARMAQAGEAIVQFVATELELDRSAVEKSAEGYLAQLAALDSELAAAMAGLRHRVLVTDHPTLGYFADRYDLEVATTLVEGGAVTSAASARHLAEVIAEIEALDVPAVFVSASSPSTVAATVASEVDGLAIVELYTESLGPAGSGADTYLDMMRINAARIADTLG